MALSEAAILKFDIHKQLQEAKKADLREIGGSGNSSIWQTLGQEDYNPVLRFPNSINVYEQMRKGDGQVRAILQIIKAPFLAAQWYVQSASDDELDKRVAKFIEWNMDNMTRTWLQFIAEALSSFDFGFYVFEKVYEEAVWRDSETKSAKPRNVIKWRKFAPRHPRTIDGWEFDVNGGLNGVKHAKTNGDTVPIPIDKLLIFTMGEEGNNPEGVSLLRPAYKHWYYKDNLYKIDAIQKERHGVGVPRIDLPVGYNTSDKKLAREMGRNLRTNDQSYIVNLPGWNVGFAELYGQLADALKSAEHHDGLIARSVLAQFLNVGTSEVGSRSTVSASQNLFMKSLRYIGDLFTGVINQFAIPQLVDYNFDVERYPKLRVRRLGDSADWRALAVTVRNLVESKVLTPNADLEEWLLDQMEFPRPPKEALEQTVKDRLEAMNGGTNTPPSVPPRPNE